MSSIAVISEYTPVEKALSVHAKNWSVRPKKPKPGKEITVKGNVKVRRDLTTEKMMPLPVNHFDRADEMLKGMQQASDTFLDRFRYPDQQSFANVQKQYGQGMWSRDLVAGILKANPNLWVEDSLNVPGSAGFYKIKDGVKVTAGIPNASFRHGFMPESTIIGESDQRLAVEFTYGWRQVLIRLRKSGDLSSRQFRKLYGYVRYNDERGKHLASNLGEFGA